MTIMTAAMEGAPETQRSNNEALQKQRAHKKENEELARVAGMEKSSDTYLEAMIYHSK